MSKSYDNFLACIVFIVALLKGILSSLNLFINSCTRKSAAGYKWTGECGRAFEVLKQQLVFPPILAYHSLYTNSHWQLMHQKVVHPDGGAYSALPYPLAECVGIPSGTPPPPPPPPKSCVYATDHVF